MFRNLSQKFNKRKKILSDNRSDFVNITDTISNLLNSELGFGDLGLKMEYSSKDRILSIRTPSKIIASELSMRSEEILKKLISKELTVSRIIVS